jgi:hypothetical protein
MNEIVQMVSQKFMLAGGTDAEGIMDKVKGLAAKFHGQGLSTPA